MLIEYLVGLKNHEDTALSVSYYLTMVSQEVLPRKSSRLLHQQKMRVFDGKAECKAPC
jgi:hypothetical protein